MATIGDFIRFVEQRVPYSPNRHDIDPQRVDWTADPAYNTGERGSLRAQLFLADRRIREVYDAIDSEGMFAEQAKGLLGGPGTRAADPVLFAKHVERIADHLGPIGLGIFSATQAGLRILSDRGKIWNPLALAMPPFFELFTPPALDLLFQQRETAGNVIEDRHKAMAEGRYNTIDTMGSIPFVRAGIGIGSVGPQNVSNIGQGYIAASQQGSIVDDVNTISSRLPWAEAGLDERNFETDISMHVEKVVEVESSYPLPRAGTGLSDDGKLDKSKFKGRNKEHDIRNDFVGMGVRGRGAAPQQQDVDLTKKNAYSPVRDNEYTRGSTLTSLKDFADAGIDQSKMPNYIPTKPGPDGLDRIDYSSMFDMSNKKRLGGENRLLGEKRADTNEDPLVKSSYRHGVIPAAFKKENGYGFHVVRSAPGAEPPIDDDDAYVPLVFTDMRPIGNKYRSVYFRPFNVNIVEGFAPSWAEASYLGRVDPTVGYQGTARNFNISFTMAVFTPMDVKTIYQKLNWLASMVYPEFGKFLEFKSGPVVRVRIGDVISGLGIEGIRGAPGVLKSLNFDYSDAPWELKRNYKVPRIVKVTTQLMVQHDRPIGRDSLGRFGGFGSFSEDGSYVSSHIHGEIPLIEDGINSFRMVGGPEANDEFNYADTVIGLSKENR